MGMTCRAVLDDHRRKHPLWELQATDEEALAAAKAAQANPFICALPEQYDRAPGSPVDSASRLHWRAHFSREAPIVILHERNRLGRCPQPDLRGAPPQLVFS